MCQVSRFSGNFISSSSIICLCYLLSHIADTAKRAEQDVKLYSINQSLNQSPYDLHCQEWGLPRVNIDKYLLVIVLTRWNLTHSTGEIMASSRINKLLLSKFMLAG